MRKMKSEKIFKALGIILLAICIGVILTVTFKVAVIKLLPDM